MSADPLPAPSATHDARTAPALRTGFPLALIVCYWGVMIGTRFLELPFFYRFLLGMAAPALFLIVFTVWWWRRKTIPLAHRAIPYFAIVGGAFAMAPLTHASVGLPQTLMFGVPLLMTAWIGWVLLVQRLGIAPPLIVSLLVIALNWGSLALMRQEGLDGDLKAALRWRWTPTAEETFLASLSKSASSNPKSTPGEARDGSGSEERLTSVPGDWPQFRGPGRDGVVPATTISTDWSAKPPKRVWKQRVGPSWSALIIVGDRLYTQEQRGEQETVVCYEAATGREVWVHEDATRFYEAVSGPGPRATPTFADGRIYTLGATGVLNCLDAMTGRPLWKHDLRVDAQAVPPLWGNSTSPLVTHGLVVAYGGGDKQNNLLAYDAESGDPKWTAEAGIGTYASPQLVTIDGVPQVLIVNESGLASVDPATGAPLWQAGVAMPGAPHNLQPHQIGERRILAGMLAGPGVALVEVAKGETGWTVTEPWKSTVITPEFSEFVIHDGHAYGFDGAIFCCLDVATGKRRWKGGRYGRGQVVLLPEQSLMVVLSETGEAILVAARPDKHEELGRFPAIEGKTWNHPVISHGRLYARNAEEMACYELAPAAAVAQVTAE